MKSTSLILGDKDRRVEPWSLARKDTKQECKMVGLGEPGVLMTSLVPVPSNVSS